MENITPKEQYDMLDVIRISGFIDRRKGLGRPTKRESRDLAKFTDGIYSESDLDFGFDFDEDDFED